MIKLALGIATAAVLLSAAPAMAQVGVRVGPFGFDVGPQPYYGCNYYNNWCNGPHYYDYYGGPRVVIGGGWHGHPHFHGHWHHH